MAELRPADEVREAVRERYAAAAESVGEGRVACCGPSEAAGGGCGCGTDVPDACGGETFGSQLYTIGDREELPDAAKLASLGCGNPTALAELHPGDVVLDLGSGGGIDVLLSAKRVGPAGKAYGLDMTDEMLALARENARKAGAENVEFLKGEIEAIPLPDDSVDVIISNCVINLSVDKHAVFAEMHRLLRPGGRLGVSDVVTEDQLTQAERAERGSYVGCIAGALSVDEYRTGLTSAGFEDVTIDFTDTVGDGVHAAIVKATKPGPP
jgi:SAM-dependent methyltransferase